MTHYDRLSLPIDTGDPMLEAPPSISFDSANGPSVIGSFQPRRRARRIDALTSSRPAYVDAGTSTSEGVLGSCGNLIPIVRPPREDSEWFHPHGRHGGTLAAEVDVVTSA
jgi:hypothetical protein